MHHRAGRGRGLAAAGLSTFIAFPDAAFNISERLAEYSQVIYHPSGRPWLIGTWPSTELVLVHNEHVRVALFEGGPADAEFHPSLSRCRDLPDVERVLRTLPGARYALAACGSATLARGDVAETRRLYYARPDGLVVLSNRIEALLGLTASTPDERALSLRLMAHALPDAVAGRPVWSGISSVRGGSQLMLDGERAQLRSWWSPPAPRLARDDRASAVADALRAGVANRLPAAAVSADLSGGLDSTSLCFLLAERRPTLSTLRWPSADPADDDARYAEHARRQLPRANHQQPTPTLPGHYDDLETVSRVGPSPWTTTAGRLRHQIEMVAATGSRLHLVGIGGDEVFGVPPAFLFGLIRRDPRLGLVYARGFRALRRWPRRALAAALLRHETLGAQLARAARQLTDPLPAPNRPDLDWGAPVRMPPWAGVTAVEAAASLLGEAARDAQPLAEDRGQHAAIELIRQAGRAVGQSAELFAVDGIDLAAPYLDDHVLQAVLAVRPEQRASPWLYKPLLTDAMRGTVDELILARTTKGAFDVDVRAGLRRNRARLLDLFVDSALADRGLIDRDAVRAAVLAPHPTNATIRQLDATIAAECWLRTVGAPAARTEKRYDGPMR